MREKVINNNDISSYYNPNNTALSPNNIDNFYKERSLRTESMIKSLKL
jgi:hypothetical protein